jgi:hypothetical protein
METQSLTFIPNELGRVQYDPSTHTKVFYPSFSIVVANQNLWLLNHQHHE